MWWLVWCSILVSCSCWFDVRCYITIIISYTILFLFFWSSSFSPFPSHPPLLIHSIRVGVYCWILISQTHHPQSKTDPACFIGVDGWGVWSLIMWCSVLVCVSCWLLTCGVILLLYYIIYYIIYCYTLILYSSISSYLPPPLPFLSSLLFQSFPSSLPYSILSWSIPLFLYYTLSSSVLSSPPIFLSYPSQYSDPACFIGVDGWGV